MTESPTKEVVKVEDEEKEGDIDGKIVIATSKKRKKASILKPMKFVAPKTKGSGEKKHISAMKKLDEVVRGPSIEADSHISEGVG